MTQTLEPEAKKFIGGGVLRKEDPEFLTGEATFKLPKGVPFNADGADTPETYTQTIRIGGRRLEHHFEMLQPAVNRFRFEKVGAVLHPAMEPVRPRGHRMPRQRALDIVRQRPCGRARVVGTQLAPGDASLDDALQCVHRSLERLGHVEHGRQHPPWQRYRGPR